MIVVKLIGGLGNQMFQYAVGRNLAIKFNKELYLDITEFNNNSKEIYTSRSYELYNFNIDAKIADENILKYFYGNSFSKIDRFFLYLMTFGHYRKIDIPLSNSKFKEFNFGSIYLRGYFQNEKYFIDSKQQIISDFKVLNYNNNRYIDIIKNTPNSVSIHVRRGDYTTNKLAINVLGLKDVEYYYKSISHIKNKLNNNSLCFFIFSDDIEWCKNNLIFEGNKIFVDDINNPITEFYLMSACNHNIISNSTYSWWSAYLNRNNYKIVIAPKNWFKNKKYKNEELVLDNWIKL